MLRDAITSLILARLVRPADPVLSVAIPTEMQLLQSTELEGGDFLPWFCRKDDPTSLVTVAGTETVALPVDFLRFQEVGLYYYDPTQLVVPGGQPWTRIKRYLNYDVMIAKFAATPSSPVTFKAPSGYHQSDNGLIYLAPIPQQVWQLRIRYYYSQPVLTTNIENNWTKYAPDLVAAVVGEKMARDYVGNTALGQAYAQDKIRARTRLYVADQARENADQVYRMGDEP